MPKHKPPAPYPREYRKRMVDLVRSGRGPEELARDFGVSPQSIRNWVRQDDLDTGRREDGLTSDEREELRRLRRENRQLREEREILKKAAAWFARETGSLPPKDSSS
jgi:transposase